MIAVTLWIKERIVVYLSLKMATNNQEETTFSFLWFI